MSVYTVSPAIGTLLTVASPATTTLYTVPTGKVFILRNVLSYTSAGTPQLTLRLVRSGVASIIYVKVYAAALATDLVETRVELVAGDVLDAATATINVIRVTVTGYLFDA